MGAPGDRRADDGTLWLEFPSVGGASPAVTVTTEPKAPQWFRRHSSQVDGEGLPWVAASGAKGLQSVTIRLADSETAVRPYRVRLYFVEPDNVQSGERVFGVTVQSRHKLLALDVVSEAGGRNRSLVKEFTGVEVGRDLQIRLSPSPASKIPVTILSGIEVQAEGW